MNEAPAHTICSAGKFVKTSRPLDIYKILKKGKNAFDRAVAMCRRMGDDRGKRLREQ
jgi:hypothetical protein